MGREHARGPLCLTCNMRAGIIYLGHYSRLSMFRRRTQSWSEVCGPTICYQVVIYHLTFLSLSPRNLFRGGWLPNKAGGVPNYWVYFCFSGPYLLDYLIWVGTCFCSLGLFDQLALNQEVNYHEACLFEGPGLEKCKSLIFFSFLIS